MNIEKTETNPTDKMWLELFRYFKEYSQNNLYKKECTWEDYKQFFYFLEGTINLNNFTDIIPGTQTDLDEAIKSFWKNEV